MSQNKTDSKKTPNESNQDLKIDFKKTSEEPIQIATKKTKEQIEIEKDETIFQQDVLSGSINNNLGKFTKKFDSKSKVVEESKIPNEELKIDSNEVKEIKPVKVLETVTGKVKNSQNRIKNFLNSIKHSLMKRDKKTVSDLAKANKNQEINFDKFSKTKQSKIRQFNIKIDILLRNNKHLLWVWLVIFAILALVLATQITFIVVLNAQDPSSGPLAASNFVPYASMRQASIVLSYIALCAPIAPIVFLITCWFIGINGVYRSRTFHYFLWFTLLISILCMITDLVMASIVIDAVNSFHAAGQ